MDRQYGPRIQQCINPEVEQRLRLMIGQPVIMVTVKEDIRGIFIDIRCPYFLIQPYGDNMVRGIRSEGVRYIIPDRSIER